MAVDAKKVQLPDSFEPIIQKDGTMNPNWYEALQLLTELANATKEEVDAQHP
jgi:hypothetical protein